MTAGRGWQLIIGIVMLFCLCIGSSASAQASFRQALPGYRFAFPRDHASHPDFKTEWWYYSGHLQTKDGQRFGYQLTFFRVGVDPSARSASRSRWTVSNLHLAHFAVSDLTHRRFQYWERRSRGALDSAGALLKRFKVWNGPWSASEDGKGQHVTAQAPGFVIDLSLMPTKPLAIHGSHGVSQKGAEAGHASHYYSLTRMTTSGTLTVAGEVQTVTGLTWMDHEFSSSRLTASQVGWDWFGIQLEDGRELMLYRLRLTDGRPDPYSSGSLIHPDGRIEHLPFSAFRLTPQETWQSPKSGGRYPIRWRLEVPTRHLDLLVQAAFPDQELDTKGSTQVTYWEGSVSVSGTADNQPIAGAGYLEMTGYSEPFRALR